jgi:hypothetical protein
MSSSLFRSVLASVASLTRRSTPVALRAAATTLHEMNMATPAFYSSGPGARELTRAERASFDANGFLVINDFATREGCAAVQARANAIVDEFDAADPKNVSIFKSGEAQSDAADDYFLSSGDQVRCFFEPEAFDDDGKIVTDKRLSINKIGHAMHELEPAFKPFCRWNLNTTAAVALTCFNVTISCTISTFCMANGAVVPSLTINFTRHHCRRQRRLRAPRAQPGLPIAASAAEHVHLQAARDWRCGHAAPRLDVSLHDAVVCHRLVGRCVLRVCLLLLFFWKCFLFCYHVYRSVCASSTLTFD